MREEGRLDLLGLVTAAKFGREKGRRVDRGGGGESLTRRLSLRPLSRGLFPGVSCVSAPHGDIHAGDTLDTLHLLNVPYGASERLKLLLLARRSPSTYVYEKVQLTVYPICEYDLFGPGDGLYRDPISHTAELTVSFDRYCSPVEFAGAVAEDQTFRVLLSDQKEDDTFELHVDAFNPDHYTLPWEAHLGLSDVRVEYRRVGSVEFLSAFNTDGGIAYLFRRDEDGVIQVPAPTAFTSVRGTGIRCTTGTVATRLHTSAHCLRFRVPHALCRVDFLGKRKSSPEPDREPWSTGSFCLSR
eukprot:2201872-Pleurochrysis_carterae.AAC.2